MEILIRPVRNDDREAVMALAPRLRIGMAAWRDEEAIGASIEEWLQLAMADDSDGAAMVATVDDAVAGFVSVSKTAHFAGEVDGYIGELIVDDTFEGHGVGRALMQAAESVASDWGLRCLTLSTGAANERAIGFYHRLGFEAEDIKLTKVLGS